MHFDEPKRPLGLYILTTGSLVGCFVGRVRCDTLQMSLCSNSGVAVQKSQRYCQTGIDQCVLSKKLTNRKEIWINVLAYLWCKTSWITFIHLVDRHTFGSLYLLQGRQSPNFSRFCLSRYPQGVEELKRGHLSQFPWGGRKLQTLAVTWQRWRLPRSSADPAGVRERQLGLG